MVAWFPDQRFSVACLCNSQQIDPRALAMRVTDLHLRGELEAVNRAMPVAEVSREELARYEGLYWSSEHKMAVPVDVVDGALALTFFFVFKSRPIALGNGRFLDENLPLPIDVVFPPENARNPVDLTN